MKKRILSIVLCLSLFVATFATTMVVSAADDVNATTGECAEIAGYREADNYTAPTTEGKAFAGWYEDADFTQAIAPSVTSGKAYARFVDSDVFTVKNQFNEDATTTSSSADLRIITTVDSEWYAGIEFEVSIAGLGTTTLPVDTIYTSIVNYTPSDVSADSQYFAVEKITGIPSAYFGAEVTITPKYTTYDGTVITGTARELVMKTYLPLGETTLTFQPGKMAAWGGWWEEIMFTANPVIKGLPDGQPCYPTWGDESGIFIDGQEASVPIISTAGVYYFDFDWQDAYAVHDGMTVTIKGTFTYQGVTAKIAPISLVFDASDTTIAPEGSWKLLSDEPEIEEPKTTISWYSGHEGSYSSDTFFFQTSSPDDVTVGTGTLWTSWGYFYLTQPDGTRVELNKPLIHFASDKYYIDLQAEQPVGAKVSIEGVFTEMIKQGGTWVEGAKVTFAPATFELQEDYSWKLVSTEPVM